MVVRRLDDSAPNLPNFLPETIHSWICAKLLLQFIAVKIACPNVAFPPAGAYTNALPNAALPLYPLPPSPPSAASRTCGRRALVRCPANLGRSLRRPAAGAMA